MSFPTNPSDGDIWVEEGHHFTYDAALNIWRLTGVAGDDRDFNGQRIINLGAPIDPTDGATKRYIDDSIAAQALWQGNYRVDTNDPDLTLVVPLHGYSWTTVTVDPLLPEVLRIVLPGLAAGTSVFNGDLLRYAADTDEWYVLHGSGLTRVEADQTYVNLTGDQLTGPLLLDGPPSAWNEAATKGYIDNKVVDIQLAYLPRDGSMPMLGPLILHNIPTLDVEAASKQYVDTKVSLAGDAMTGRLILAGEPTAPLEAATKEYVDDTEMLLVALDGSRIMTGGLNINLNEGGLNAVPTPALTLVNGGRHAVPTEGIQIELRSPMGGRPQWITSTSDIGGGGGPAGESIRFSVNDHVGGAWPANALHVAIFDNTGITAPQDGEGLNLFGGGRFYKAVGGGIRLRQSSGNQQPMIENNDGSNVRAILDENSGVRTIGDMKMGFQQSDHNGWYLANGRATSQFPASVRAAAASLGFANNLPDARGHVPRYLGSGTLGQLSGSMSRTLAQSQLPNITLQTSYTGSHQHASVGQVGGNDKTFEQAQGNPIIYGLFAGGWVDGYAYTQWKNLAGAAGDHSHSVSLGGSGAAIDITPSTINVNMFIYLGA